MDVQYAPHLTPCWTELAVLSQRRWSTTGPIIESWPAPLRCTMTPSSKRCVFFAFPANWPSRRHRKPRHCMYQDPQYRQRRPAPYVRRKVVAEAASLSKVAFNGGAVASGS